MNRWPGERSGALNPLRLNKKLWIEAQCTKFLKNQELTQTNDIRKICLKLFTEQKKIANLSYADCNQITGNHFSENAVEEADMFDNQSDDEIMVEGDNDSEKAGETGNNDSESNANDGIASYDHQSGVEDNASDFDTSESDDDDEETLDYKIKNMLAKTYIGDLVNDEDSIPMEIKQSKRYRNTKKKFVLSQYEEKNSQEIVSNLSQVPESVGTVNCLLPSSA